MSVLTFGIHRLNISLLTCVYFQRRFDRIYAFILLIKTDTAVVETDTVKILIFFLSDV